jgi:hypothetical protein
MKNRQGNLPEALIDQALTVAEPSESGKKSSSESASEEKVEAQSKSYRRSREVALMKLALLRPHSDNPE